MEFIFYFGDVFTPVNFALLLVGTIGGLILGATPGLSPTMAVALLIPFTFKLEATQGLILLGAAYTSTVAGGRVGWNWLATQADADGYTLGAYNVPHFIAQSIEGGVSYSVDSFEPIANWGADPAVFVVGADSEFNSMADVIAYAEENPGSFTFSGAGLFVGHHIAALQLEKATGTKLAYIPNNAGGAGAMKAVIAGEVLGGVNNLSDAFRAREAGNVKILGVFDLERNEFLPDVPTMKEQGYDIDDASVNFRGVMVPKGTPQPIIDKLAATVPAMFENSRVQGKMKAGGSPMHVMTRDEVLDMWAKRQETLTELLAGL